MWTTVLTLIGSVLSVIVAAIVTYSLTRRREHEAEWRKLKFAQYQELLVSLSGIVEGRNSAEAQARYADAVNSMALVAPGAVLCALHNFQNEISYRNERKTQDEHDRLLRALFNAMRADIHPTLPRQTEDFEFCLITVPPSVQQA